MIATREVAKITRSETQNCTSKDTETAQGLTQGFEFTRVQFTRAAQNHGQRPIKRQGKPSDAKKPKFVIHSPPVMNGYGSPKAIDVS